MKSGRMHLPTEFCSSMLWHTIFYLQSLWYPQFDFGKFKLQDDIRMVETNFTGCKPHRALSTYSFFFGWWPFSTWKSISRKSKPCLTDRAEKEYNSCQELFFCSPLWVLESTHSCTLTWISPAFYTYMHAVFSHLTLHLYICIVQHFRGDCRTVEVR